MNTTNKANLRNLSESLAVTLARLEKAKGVKVTIKSCQREGEDGDVYHLKIDPLIVCPTCNRLSAATECLWCETDFHGEGVA